MGRSSNSFSRKSARLAREFDALNNDDATLNLEERQGATLVLALRDWRYGLFRPIIR
jgi:hypothetical protein